MSEKEKESKFEKAELMLRKFTSFAIKVSVIILFAVIAWRIAWSQFNLDLSKFDFSDLLAMILALFAIIMSVAFYFKSTDSSNQFYDNIYNFTQKTSEILGRIEERFGERLRHIDEGYGRIESRFVGIAKSSAEIEEQVIETQGKEKEEKNKLKETNEEMHKIMEELTNRAKMQEQEKLEFYKNIERLTSEKNAAQMRLHQIEQERDMMQHQLETFQRDIEPRNIRQRYSGLNVLREDPEIIELIISGAPRIILDKKIRNLLNRYPNDFIDQLIDDGIINRNLQISRDALDMIRSNIKSRR